MNLSNLLLFFTINFLSTIISVVVGICQLAYFLFTLVVCIGSMVAGYDACMGN